MAYDVFISFKNSDANGRPTKESKTAKKLYDFLTAKGLHVFFSNVELEFIGKAKYTEVIDEALDSSRFLIAVGSTHDNLNSQWVRYEWESFLNDIRSGIKPNAEVFGVYEDMKIPHELPRALRQQQSFSAADSGAFEKLYNFIKNAGVTTTGVGEDQEKENGEGKRTGSDIETPRSKQPLSSKTKVFLAAAVALVVVAGLIFGGIALWGNKGGTDDPEALTNGGDGGANTSTSTPGANVDSPGSAEPEVITNEPTPPQNSNNIGVSNVATYNLSNGGKMLQNGNDVFYSRWDGILYKTEIGKDDNDRTAIYRTESGDHIGNINIDGTTLYFYETTKGLCRINTDGTGFQLLENFAEIAEIWPNAYFSPQTMILINDVLYINFSLVYYGDPYLELGRLYKYNVNTGIKEIISNDGEEIRWITVFNDYLYYVINDDFNDGSIIRIGLGSTQRDTIAANLRATSILIDDDHIYYFTFYDAYIYRIKHDGTDKERISNDRGDTYFTMDSEWVYYRYGWGVGGGSKIYAFNKASFENIEFTTGDIDNLFGLYIIGGQLYYLDGTAMTKKPIYTTN